MQTSLVQVVYNMREFIIIPAFKLLPGSGLNNDIFLRWQRGQGNIELITHTDYVHEGRLSHGDPRFVPSFDLAAAVRDYDAAVGKG